MNRAMERLATGAKRGCEESMREFVVELTRQIQRGSARQAGEHHREQWQHRPEQDSASRSVSSCHRDAPPNASCLDSILLRGFAPRHGDAALQKPGHFGLHMSAKEKEQAPLLASASHTVAERLGINGYV